MSRRFVAGARACVLLLGVSCAKGGPSSTTGLSVGSLGESSGGGSSGTGTGTSTTGTTTTGTGSGGADGSSTGLFGATGSSSSTGPAPACDDGIKNGTESDVDCGGTCLPCTTGHTCVQSGDCMTGICDTGLCCTVMTYMRSTGLVSGSGMVCCDGDDMRTDIQKCGDGQNYSADPAGANCATTVEGANDNGSACVQVTCQKTICTP